MGACLGLFALVLLTAPVLKAWAYGKVLDADMAIAMGHVTPRANAEHPARRASLIWQDLFRGVSLPQVESYAMSYAKRGEDIVLQVDLYHPPGNAPGSAEPIRRPLVVVLHDGNWESGSRAEQMNLNVYLTNHGYAVAAIDYRQGSSAPYPAALDDLLDAIQYLKGLARSAGFDSRRIILLGRGSGAQLALLAAYRRLDPAIVGVIAMSPPTDLGYWYLNPGNQGVVDVRRVLQSHLGIPYERVGASSVYESASPRTFANGAPPTLLIHGLRDPVIPAAQSDRLAERLHQLRVPHVYVKLPWATHGCDSNFHGPCGQVTTYAIERFLSFVAP
jgi:acetyl esterase/lipase